MVSASVIGAIPGIDDDWVSFAKRSVTNSDITTALGFTPADSTKVLPLSGGTLTGNLTGKYIIGTWLQATDAGHLATTPTKIPVFDDKGWIYYRTPAEILKDIGASSGYTLTEADKTEIAGKVVADGGQRRKRRRDGTCSRNRSDYRHDGRRRPYGELQPDCQGCCCRPDRDIWRN